MAHLIANYGPPPWDEVLQSQSCKYAPVRFALAHTTPWIQHLVKHMRSLLPGERKYTVVDIKVWPLLKAGQAPALVGWHLDCVKDLDNPLPPEHHALYQSGAQCFTQFRDLQIHDGDLVRFGREFHSATRARQTGPRILVRVSQSDHIRGVPRLITPTIKECSDA